MILLLTVFRAKSIMSSMAKLSDKISIITGAASGIGLATSKRFAKEGSKIMMVDSDLNGLIEAYDDICKSHGDKTCYYMHGDVTQKDFALKTMLSTMEYFGKSATILVNCAGISQESYALNMTENQFKNVVNVNLNGTFFFIQAFLQHLKDKSLDSKSFASSIVNIASLAGKLGMIENAHYAASKSGVIGLTKSICIEMGKYGVRCNAILPGIIETPMINSQVGSSRFEHYIRNNPMRHIGRPEEVANACLFLASDESSYVNGACLEVGGGTGA